MTVSRLTRTRRAACGGVLAACLMASAVLVAVPASATTGGHRIAVKSYGFSVILPPGWYQLALTGPNAGSLLGGAPNYDAFKASLVSEANSAAAKSLKFYAVALSQANGMFLPIMNVGRFKGSGSQAILDVEVKGYLAEEGAQSGTVKNVTLRPGKAVEATYELLTPSAPPIWETQVYAPHGRFVYVATFSALTKPAVELTAAVVMYDWRFTKKS